MFESRSEVQSGYGCKLVQVVAEPPMNQQLITRRRLISKLQVIGLTGLCGYLLLLAPSSQKNRSKIEMIPTSHTIMNNNTTVGTEHKEHSMLPSISYSLAAIVRRCPSQTQNATSTDVQPQEYAMVHEHPPRGEINVLISYPLVLIVPNLFNQGGGFLEVVSKTAI